ncbi:MAG: glutamine--fructose-6-phosphate transaminase (isomerizing) [Thermodesulfobacteriota bacterium]|nr:glutamine--fructose-6-phosphate transaminase (isomerizing) [Thermodesulfobacteriota bacterium]
MCGISGVVSSHPIADQLFKGIKNLEYRGYDSCGIAFMNPSKIQIRKDKGYVDKVNEIKKICEVSGHVGIAHTRWATHGKVTKTNAHPHMCCRGDFAVVHNGIISNYRNLRDELIKDGHQFSSETDSEVMAHLVEKYYSTTKDVEKAFIESLNRLEGSYAFALISIYEPERIFCARHKSPLMVGVGEGSNYLGSDFNAFLDYTKKVVFLDDGEYGIISKNHYNIKEIKNERIVEKPITEILWDPETSKKNGYPHYMLKEIHEQPNAILSAMGLDSKNIIELSRMILEADQCFLVGVGTTYYVSIIGQYFFSIHADHFIPALSSDEFTNLAKPTRNSLAIFISQSGETYDTLSALRLMKEAEAKTCAIVNVMGSSLSRMVDHAIMQGSGPEICVVSTKAATAQMIILFQGALELASKKGILSFEERNEIQKEIVKLPQVVHSIIERSSEQIHGLARKYSHMKNWLWLGRGIYYPLALESALKMKEVTYLHAEGMPGGFLKHGTLSLIDDDMYTVVLVPPQEEKELYQLTMSSVEEIKARGGIVIGIGFDDSENIFDEKIILPKVHRLLAPFLPLMPAQLFAYFVALSLDREIDKPRSLAKSVTVA